MWFFFFFPQLQQCWLTGAKKIHTCISACYRVKTNSFNRAPEAVSLHFLSAFLLPFLSRLHSPPLPPFHLLYLLLIILPSLAASSYWAATEWMFGLIKDIPHHCSQSWFAVSPKRKPFKDFRVKSSLKCAGRSLPEMPAVLSLFRLTNQPQKQSQALFQT